MKRVLVMSASAGTGHVRAAEALVKAFSNDPLVERVIHEDALNYTNTFFRDFYSKFYTQLVRFAPEFLGWWYDASDEPWKTDRMRIALDRLNTGPLVKMIKQFDPHITVCTHFMPAGIMSHLIAKEVLEAHLSIVVTDMDFHAMWLSRVFHRYFVAIDETRAHLQALGLPQERISVTGIPVDPVFAEPVDVESARKSYGLQPDRPTLLVSAGALGVSPAEFVVERLRTLNEAYQVVVVCGKNHELRDKLRQAHADVHPRFLILGYTDEMHVLMKMSDLYIGKPGGLTTAETLACGLPMIIVDPIPGQEERNSDHLLEDGVAVKCNEYTTIPYKVERLFGNPGRLEGMRQRAKALGQPNAATKIAQTLIHDKLPPLTFSKQERDNIAQQASGGD
ncbi:MAG: glycosyltransferase [Verrucomicrobiales bacterium]